MPDAPNFDASPIDSKMMQIACYRDGLRVLAPIVGYIDHRDCALFGANGGVCVVASIRRLGVPIGVSVTECTGGYIADAPNGTYVDVGMPIGRIELPGSAQTDGFSASDAGGAKQNERIAAPVSGFLIYDTHAGIPYCKKGDKISPGAPIAAVEFMKLRVEIAYEGLRSAIFAGYAQKSGTPIDRGDVIAWIRPTDEDAAVQ